MMGKLRKSLIKYISANAGTLLLTAESTGILNLGTLSITSLVLPSPITSRSYKSESFRKFDISKFRNSNVTEEFGIDN